MSIHDLGIHVRHTALAALLPLSAIASDIRVDLEPGTENVIEYAQGGVVPPPFMLHGLQVARSNELAEAEARKKAEEEHEAELADEVSPESPEYQRLVDSENDKKLAMDDGDEAPGEEKEPAKYGVLDEALGLGLAGTVVAGDSIDVLDAPAQAASALAAAGPQKAPENQGRFA